MGMGKFHGLPCELFISPFTLRACSLSFFQSHFVDMLSEKPEDRRSVATATVRRSEGFAAKLARNGVGKKIVNRLLTPPPNFSP